MSALNKQEGGTHYKTLSIQPIEYIHANKLPFAEGCVVKYVTRWRGKGGIKDLEKARHFIDLLIELETRAACATVQAPSLTGESHVIAPCSVPTIGHPSDLRQKNNTLGLEDC